MAQEVHAAVGLGESDKHISTVDADGIAFAAIQVLNAKLETRMAKQTQELAQQAREIAELRRAVDVLMARTAITGEVALGK